jgi:hypothetical protein
MGTVDGMVQALLSEEGKVRKRVTVNDKMQRGYSYDLVMPEGDLSDLRHSFPLFAPHYTPQQMLAMGVFEGKYFRDCHREFPSAWFHNAKEAQGDQADPSLNRFGVASRLPLPEWVRMGWIHPQDPRGWAQWYFRLYHGRRSDDDVRQIGRWLSIKRHAGQIQANCKPGDLTCRPRQRQTLLQWSYQCDI